MVLFYADVAQQEAQQTFNLWATGSIPVIRTMSGSETALFACIWCTSALLIHGELAERPNAAVC